ncbi:MAG: glycosyltransferase family 9 protein [Thermomicrobium sp.]
MFRDRARTAVRWVGQAMPVPVCAPSVRREVVLVRPDHLGDAILTLPALRLVRQVAPRLTTTLLVGPWTQELFAMVPVVDRVLPVAFPGFTRRPATDFTQPYRLLVRAAAQLRRQAPLAMVVLRDDHWWGAWLGYLAGIPIRVGADHPALRPFLTHPVPLKSEHVAARNIELVRALLRLLGYDLPESQPTAHDHPIVWPVDRGAQSRVWARLAAWGIHAPFAVVHPGSGAAAKCWPEQRWAALVDALTNLGLAVILTGSQSEQPVLEAIAKAARATPLVLASALSLAELAELLRAASLVVGPDTGPLHLAVAVGAPTVHLFGPTRPARFGPWGPATRHRVVRSPLECPRCGDIGPARPCGVGCMMALSVERVVAAVEDCLSKGLSG